MAVIMFGGNEYDETSPWTLRAEMTVIARRRRGRDGLVVWGYMSGVEAGVMVSAGSRVRPGEVEMTVVSVGRGRSLCVPVGVGCILACGC